MTMTWAEMDEKKSYLDDIKDMKDTEKKVDCDPVNHPSHYADHCSIECFDAMKLMLGNDGLLYFCIGNAFKYLWRCDHKGKKKEDLDKASWYLREACTLNEESGIIDFSDKLDTLRNMIDIKYGKIKE